MPYEHGRKGGTIEKFAYGRNHSFYRRSVDQVTYKSCPKDLQLPELAPTGQSLPLFTVIFVGTDAFRKASSCPLLPDTVESGGFESETPSRMDGHDRPSPQLFMVGLQDTDFTRLYSTCIYSEASSSDQSMNKTPSPLVSPNTPLPCHSTSGNSSGSVCDGGAAVGTDFLVNDFPKAEKRVKRNPRKKGKKKGKQYKRIASRKVSTETDVQSNGNTYSESTFEASNPNSLSSSGKHHFDNNLSDETPPSSLLDSDITLDKDDCPNNIDFVDCTNLFSSTSYSDEMEEVPLPQRFAADESGCNPISLHSSCTVDAEAVPFTSSGSSGDHRFKKNNIHDGNFPSISVDKSWNSDTVENSSDKVATHLAVKDETGLSSSEGEIVSPSEEVTQHNPSSSTITIDLHNLEVERSKDFYNNDSFLSNNVLDACSSTERVDSNSQVGSSNDFHPVIYGKRGRRSRRMINSGSSNGANRYTATNIHSHTGKDSNYSIWQKVQKFENKGSISKPNDVSVFPSHQEVPSKDTKMRTKNNKLVGVKEKQSGMTCRYSSSDATSKLLPNQVASRGPKTGRNPPKSIDGNSINGERSKSSSGVKHVNQYHQSGTYTGNSDMSDSSKNHFHQKEDLQTSSHIHLDNHSVAGLKSPCDNLSQRCLSEMTDNIDCCLTEPEKEINVLMEEIPSEDTCNATSYLSLPASCGEIIPLPTTSGQFNQREFETNYDNDKTRDTKHIQEGHSSVAGEDQQLMKPEFESYKEPNSLSSARAPVQKWVPVGRKDLAVSVNNDAVITQLTSGVAEVEDLSSNDLSFNGKDAEVSCPGATKVTNKFTSYHPTEVLDYTVINDQTREMEEKKFIGFDTDLDKIIGAVNDASKFQAIVEGAQVATGRTVADFEEFLSSASPVIRQTQRGRTCNSLCLQIPNISLKHIWQWYEEPGCFGLEVKAGDFCSSKRLWNGCFGFTAYFVPYLSAVQLFQISSSSRDCLLSGQPALSSHMDRSAKSWSSLGSLPDLSMILPHTHKDTNVCLSEFASSSQDVSDKNNHLGQEELIFEYFESEQPPRRRPLYDKIKELVNDSTLNDGRVFGDPLQLESVELHDLHPASWYCVAWYPIYRIPDGNFHTAFLTYHSLGHFVHQSAPRSVGGASRNLVSPVVGLQTYNDKGENWFRPRDSDSKVVLSGDAPYSNTAELIKERLRTLKQTASVMARAVVCRGKQKSVNRHPDYEFFLSRSW